MSVPESVIEDIAVLKSQHSEIRRTVEEGNRATQNAIANLSGRMEVITGLMQDLAKLDARHDAQSEGLQRAFQEIQATDKVLAEHVDSEGSWRKEHEKENAATERTLSRWSGIAIGITLTIGVATAIATAAGGMILERLQDDISSINAELKAQDARIDKAERK